MYHRGMEIKDFPPVREVLARKIARECPCPSIERRRTIVVSSCWSSCRQATPCFQCCGLDLSSLAFCETPAVSFRSFGVTVNRAGVRCVGQARTPHRCRQVARFSCHAAMYQDDQTNKGPDCRAPTAVPFPRYCLPASFATA